MYALEVEYCTCTHSWVVWSYDVHGNINGAKGFTCKPTRKQLRKIRKSLN